MAGRALVSTRVLIRVLMLRGCARFCRMLSLSWEEVGMGLER
jgi:hypothetical protein